MFKYVNHRELLPSPEKIKIPQSVEVIKVLALWLNKPDYLKMTFSQSSDYLFKMANGKIPRIVLQKKLLDLFRDMKYIVRIDNTIPKKPTPH